MRLEHATVTLTVNDVNDPPVATDNDYTTDEDTQATGNVVIDDTGDGVDSIRMGRWFRTPPWSQT